jgi:DNA polymerase I-like protein with 3'-5' exonuclease and polymerase domains
VNITFLDVETSTPDPSNKDLALDTARCKLDLVGTLENKALITPYTQQFPNDFFKNANLCGHNLKFDFRVLHHKGVILHPSQCVHDTLVMAVASITKVSEEYTEEYEKKRRELNKALPKGQGYREAKKHSLKILAPYFLGVSPFWENTETTNDPEYLRKDLEYTKGLYEYFSKQLVTEGVWEFYCDKLMPWQRMTLQMELDGICVDTTALKELKAKAEAGALTSLAKLREAWKKVEEQWQAKCYSELRTKYQELTYKAIIKAKGKDEAEQKAKQEKTALRYRELENKAAEKIEPFNYASPAQLLWAFKNVLGYQTVNLEGDETTGASILELLAAQGKEDIKALLDYKANYKLAHAYFPSYEELMLEGKIHAAFNLHGAKTGRLSSSNPNLQQIPPELKKLFVPAPGNVFVSQDLSAIEPVLIAYYTEDKNLCDIFIKNQDFHGYCATALFPAAGLLPEWVKPSDVKKQYPDIRQAAKQADLSIFYGSGKNRLFTTLTLHGMKVDEKQCQRMVYRMRDTFKEAWEFKLMLDAELLGGNYVENLFGRRFKIEHKDDVYMQGFNRLIQGSASDLLMQGALKTLAELGKKGIWARPRLAVHDNFVIECKEADGKYVYDTLEKNLTSFVLNTKHGRIPLKVEGTYGSSWKC